MQVETGAIAPVKFKGRVRKPRDGETLSSSGELRLGRELTVAWLYTAEDGGPVRSIINGRHRKPTGRLSLVKAGHRSMPWESQKAELPFLRLAEVATPVHSILAQPHRIEMNVDRSLELWDYTPDCRLVTDSAFADDLAEGLPFARAVAEWSPDRATGETRTIIIEVKDDRDPRLHDPRYRTKLRLAKEVYEGLGWSFYEVVRFRDLCFPPIENAVHTFFLDHDTSVCAQDIRLATELAAAGGTLGQLIHVLGGPPIGRAKAAALHCRRIISVDLTRSLAPDSAVRPVLLARGGLGLVRA
jgi:hypothetical protein